MNAKLRACNQIVMIFVTTPTLKTLITKDIMADIINAISDGVLYSAYIHPLSDLSRPQLKSAVVQVANLALSFGTEYTSGVLTFGGEKPAEESTVTKGEISLCSAKLMLNLAAQRYI